MDLAIRFVVGGFVVSFVAMIGGALKPKSFAGLFAAALSVALATISLKVAIEMLRQHEQPPLSGSGRGGLAFTSDRCSSPSQSPS
jgi:hypothetical protein